MSAQPLIDYFQPLLSYLRAANGDEVGWSADCPSFADPLSSAGHVRPLAGLTFILVIIALAYLVWGAWDDGSDDVIKLSTWLD